MTRQMEPAAMRMTLLVGALLGVGYPANAQEARQSSVPSNVIAAVAEPEKQFITLPPPPSRFASRPALAMAIDTNASSSRAASSQIPIPQDRPTSAPPREVASPSLLASITEGLFSPKLMGWKPESNVVTAQVDTAQAERPAATDAAPPANSSAPPKRTPPKVRSATQPAARPAAAGPVTAATPAIAPVRPAQLPEGVSPGDFQDWQSEPHLATAQAGQAPGTRANAPAPVRPTAPSPAGSLPVGAADRKPPANEANQPKPVVTTAQAKPGAAVPKPAQVSAGKPAAAPAATDADAETAQFCGNITNAAADARVAWQQEGLKKAEEQLRERIVELEKKRAEYEQWLKRREDFLKKAEDNVVQIYSRMKPDAAAIQLAGMQEETAAAVLVKLTPRNSSAILNEMEPGRAAHLANTLAGMNRPNDGAPSK